MTTTKGTYQISLCYTNITLIWLRNASLFSISISQT